VRCSWVRASSWRPLWPPALCGSVSPISSARYTSQPAHPAGQLGWLGDLQGLRPPLLVGIRVNVVAPGAVATDFSGGVVRDNPQVGEMVRGVTALGRVAEPDDIGAAVALLLADGFGWANGAKIELTGGQRL